MHTILLFGTGKSATVLIDYLLANAAAGNWQLIAVDANLQLAQSKTGNHPRAQALSFDITNEKERQQHIADADIVISLLPPTLHYLVATDCLALGKHLLTASYVDEKIKALEKEIAAKQLLFLCEMGLDPGIDHMSALQLINHIKAGGGTITSFISHCGGLVAPESDNNPWHYKISWNPRNVVLAGKAGADYREASEARHLDYQHLFNPDRTTHIAGLGSLAYYPNRDSLSYIPLYQLDSCQHFIRTTLRYPGFCAGWQQIIALQLTNETARYDTNDCTRAQFLEQHIERRQLQETWQQLQHDTTFMQQLQFLGFFSDTPINKGECTAADVLQLALETNLVLEPQDKDMIVMQHEIGYTDAAQQPQQVTSTLIVKGEDSLRTAMAKTVGLPLGIAAKLILNGTIQCSGLHIPLLPEIYEPVLKELEANGVQFTKTHA